MSAQLVVGPHSSSSLIRTNSVFTVEEITVNNLNITTSLNFTGDLTVNSLDVTTDINVTGVYNIDGIEVLSEDTLGSGIINSSLTSVGNLTDLTVIGDFTVDTDTFFVDSSSNNVGINNTSPNALYVLDISGNTNIDGGVTISGDLNVLGGITSTFSTTATVEENFVKLATSNTADMIDTGIYNLYNDGTTRFAGYARDATDGVFKFFTGTTEEPGTTIDFSNPSISFADILVSNVEASTMEISTTGTIQDLSITNNLFVGNNTNISGDLIVDNNIGINNSAPAFELDVSGDINSTNEYKIDGISVLTEDTLGIGITTSSLEVVGTLETLDITGDLSVNTDILYVDTAANRVGIGRSDPAYRLDVTGGSINTTETYKIGGIDVLSSDTLESTILNSSLTSVGNLVDLTVDTDTLVVDAAANHVGIGITNPDEPLHIFENSLSDQQLHIENPNASGSAGIEIDNDGATGNLKIQQTGDESFFTNFGGNMEFLAKDIGRHSFYTTDSDLIRLRIQNDGDIGVGTATPSYRLDISGGDINVQNGDMYRIGGVEIVSSTGITSLGDINFNSTSRFEEQGGNIYVSTTDIRQFEFNTSGNFEVINGNIGVGTIPGIAVAIGTTGTGIDQVATNELGLYTGGQVRVRIDDDGLVGLNNSNPLHRLDVAGSINFTGQLLQNGVQFIGTDGIWTQQGTGAFVTLGGAIGIGTTTPAAQLHVEGDGIISGNVGIGTTTPERSLDIISSNLRPVRIETTNDQNGIQFINNSGTNGDLWQFGFDKTSDLGTTGKFRINHGVSGSFWDCIGIERTGDTTGNLTLGDDDDICDLIIQNGNIGIGITNPTLSLAIGDDNTGLQQGGEDILEFVTGGSVRGSFNANGNLSIGSSTGTVELLHLHESSSGGSKIQITNTTTGTGSANGFTIGINSSETAEIRNKENTSMTFWTDNISRMTLASGGNLTVSTGNITATAGDITATAGDITATAGNAIAEQFRPSADITNGALAFTLVDSISTSILSDVNYTGSQFDLSGEDTTDVFSTYKIVLKGVFTGNGGTPRLHMRFFDAGGEMSVANSYYTNVVGWGGSTILDTRSTTTDIVRWKTTTSSELFFSASYTLTLGTREELVRMEGQTTMGIANGTNIHMANVACCLTDVDTISTAIDAIGFSCSGITTGSGRELYARIYRLY